jgi:hypothetical protein
MCCATIVPSFEKRWIATWTRPTGTRTTSVLSPSVSPGSS